MSLEKEHPRNAGKPRCERCNLLLVSGETITCDPCAAGLALDLANGTGLARVYGVRWPARQVELRAEAAYLRLASTRPAYQWRGIFPADPTAEAERKMMGGLGMGSMGGLGSGETESAPQGSQVATGGGEHTKPALELERGTSRAIDESTASE